MTNLLGIIFASIFVNNYVLAQFLGICPAIGVSSKTSTALGMGAAVTFVVTFASIITLVINNTLLVPNDLVYLQTIVFILVIAALVQLVEMFMKKSTPALYNALGVYLPLITTNCIVLGVAIVNVNESYTMIETIANSVAASIGFTIVIILLSAIREKYELVDVPKAFRNVPLAMITLGLMSMAFTGFKGMF